MNSFPMALAKQDHRFKAKVAPELAAAGFCSPKKLHYYSVRVYMIGRVQAGTLRHPEYIGVTGAHSHDGKVFDQIRPELTDNVPYGDKACQRLDTQEIRRTQNLTVPIPVKKQKGQDYLETKDQRLSTAVSRVRQPIEALFAWIEQQTGIECASKGCSYNSLMVHVFGKIGRCHVLLEFLAS